MSVAKINGVAEKSAEKQAQGKSLPKEKPPNDKHFKSKYPAIGFFMGVPRNAYLRAKRITSYFGRRHKDCACVPHAYTVHNKSTTDGQLALNVVSGKLPQDIKGSVYICQCLGTPEAYMMGDTNLVKIGFSAGEAQLHNHFMWSPCSIAKAALRKTKHRFRNFGLMQLSAGLGMSCYTEGVYLLPDGRLALTSDVDRPWIVDRAFMRVRTPLGKRSEWLPMMTGETGRIMGPVFTGHNTSHAMYADTHTGETFLVNYQGKQPDGTHPCRLMRWRGEGELESWKVCDESGKDIRIRQSVHELIFTRDYIILADAAFAVGMGFLTPWKSTPLPSQKTDVYIVDRRQLVSGQKSVCAKRAEIDEACIHLAAEYENPQDVITVYMLHTPATNTAEIIRIDDKDLGGVHFAKHMVGYGTLPVMDISAVGKHTLNIKNSAVHVKSEYIQDERYCWGPYIYTYMGRQTRPLCEQDLFVMFKGFKRELLPRRIYEAHKDMPNRKVPLERMVSPVQNGKSAGGIDVNNCIVRIDKERFQIADAYEMPNGVYLHTIACIESSDENACGYVLAGVVRDVEQNEKSSGHEYWLFEADKLSCGPICTLSHPLLNNSILFHALYLSHKQEKLLDKKDATYHVSLREDFPKEEIERYNPEVMQVFEKVIWPYFGQEEKASERRSAERILAELEKVR